MILIKKGLKYLPSLKPIYALAERCERADNYPMKMYWHILQERRQGTEHDYIAYLDHKLVGSLSVFYFSEGVEINMTVDPLYRNRGIAKKLLAVALMGIKKFMISDCVLVCNIKNILVREKLISLGAQFVRSDIEMYAPEIFLDNTNSSLVLYKAQITDMDTLLDITQQCYPQSEFDKILVRYNKAFQQSNRQIYIAKSLKNKMIRMLHVRIEDKRTILHDIGIIPEVQRQGHGRELIQIFLNQFGNQLINPIIVEVHQINHAAIALYQSCDFDIQNCYEYWRISLVQLERYLTVK